MSLLYFPIQHEILINKVFFSSYLSKGSHTYNTKLRRGVEIMTDTATATIIREQHETVVEVAANILDEAE
ncbi:hypothetical protein D3C74_309720 [compost metagenome]